MSKKINFTYEELKSKNGSKCRENNVKKNFPEKYNEILIFKENNNLDLNFSELLYLYLHNLTPPLCQRIDCNNPLQFESFNFGYKGTYCSTKCANSDPLKKKKAETTLLKNFGVSTPLASPNIRKKVEQTLMDRYGVKNIMKLSETQEKIKETMLSRYGVDNAMKLEEFLNKALETNKQNHGGLLNLQNTDIRNKRDEKANKQFKKKYSDINFINSQGKNVEFLCGCENDIISSLDRATFRFRYHNNIKLCTTCNPIDNSSYGEKTLQEFIQTIYNGEIIFNDRSILNGKELDIYLPNENLAIEYNGLYWHSEAKVDKNYHIIKTDLCLSKGITLLHIFEDEWINQTEIVKSIIKNKLGLTDLKIFARKTQLKKISTKQAREFLDTNHIQKYCPSAHKFGLFYNNELISVMTFGKLRLALGKKSVKDSYELLRFANKKYTTVIGAASKLYNFFIQTYRPDYVLSYANRRLFTGNMYNMLGLNFSGITPINYFYIKKTGDLYVRENRFTYRKNVLVNEGYDKNKTEKQIMQERGFLRIYDCGNYKFAKYYKKS